MSSTGDLRFEELIDAAIKAKLSSVHTSCPGIIVKYNKGKSTVDVQPAVSKPVERLNGGTVFKKFPVIMNVPIAWPAGGGYVMRWPLLKGDMVELRFSQLATGQFRSTGKASDPEMFRMHDLSYPTAWPCEIRFSEASATPSDIADDALQIDGPGGLMVGKPSVAEAVAMASKALNAINAIFDAIDAGVPIAQDGGVGLQSTILAALALSGFPLASGSLDASNLKAEP